MTIRNSRVTKRLVAVAAAAATTAALLVVPTAPVGATSTVSVVRVSGVDREATSVAISTGAVALGANTTHFVLANSRSYADSVTASALAGHLDGTIILLPNDGSLSVAAKTRLAGATAVHIVGGSTAVPSTVEAAVQLATTGSTVFTRHAGANRYATMAAVAAAVGTPGLLAAKKTVFLANADNFADAVTASPAAYAGRHQILITGTDSLNAVTRATITSLSATQVVILGGTTAISAAVEAEVDAMTGVSVIRVAGADRYETANEFAKLLIKSTGTGGFGWTAANVGLANLSNSNGGADALAASAYLGQAKAPMLGTNNGVLPAITTAFLDTNKAAVAKLHVFGGTTAVPADVVTAAQTGAGKLANPTATITASEKFPLATITFSEAVTPATANVEANYQLLAPNGAAELTAEIDSVVLTVAAGATTGTTAVMTLLNPDTKLLVGATIQVLPLAIQTADGRTVDAASTVILDDATKPAATLQAVVGTAGGSNLSFSVSFSEPVNTALTNTMFKVNGVALTTGVAATYKLNGVASTAVNYNSAVVTVAADDALGQAETLSINAGAVGDFAGNASTTASTTVGADNVAPTVVSATVAVTAATTAQVVSGEAGLLFQAKTAGVAGNDVVIDFEAEAGAATTVTTAVAAPVTTITVTPKTGATGAEVAASIRANATANALVTITVLVAGAPAAYADTAADPLVGGSSLATVTTTYSEIILAADGALVSYDGDAGAAGAAVTGAAAATVTGNVVVSKHTLSATDQLPTLNVANVTYTAGAVVDIGQNPLDGVIKVF